MFCKKKQFKDTPKTAFSIFFQKRLLAIFLSIKTHCNSTVYVYGVSGRLIEQAAY
jgi:hypothetical protein